MAKKENFQEYVTRTPVSYTHLDVYKRQKHSRQCACDRKAYEEEQKYFKGKKHRELVGRNTSICFDESRMEEWTFENADMSDAVMHRAKNYVENWDEMQRNHICLLYTSDTKLDF